MTIVDRDLGAPLHHQIYLVLADGIAAGRYAAGELLPTEEQLGKLFSVSRITVRRAMASLQNAGLIERGAGRRTMVKPLGKPLKMPMASVISNIAAYGAQTVAKVSSSATARRPPSCASGCGRARSRCSARCASAARRASR